MPSAPCCCAPANRSIADDHVWQATARAHGGIIISIDGIPPDKGNETIYLVRAVITGRLLAAEPVRSSDAATITALLRPIHDLGLPVIGAVSDAQESLLQGMAALWPDIPHQVCQFHYLREASRPMDDGNRKVRNHLRNAIQQDGRSVRQQLERHRAKLDPDTADDQRTAAQMQLLDDDALATQTALNVDALQLFADASPVKGGRESGRRGQTRPLADGHRAARAGARRAVAGAATARRRGGGGNDPVGCKTGGTAPAGDERGGAGAVCRLVWDAAGAAGRYRPGCDGATVPGACSACDH